MLQIGVQVLQPADFGVKNQRLGLPVEREVSAATAAVEVRFLHALDLHFADGAAHPLGGIRLRRFEEDLRGGLREHDLGEVAVDDFQLRLALETENDRVARFAILGDGGVQLRQLLQAGQLVEHKPDRTLSGVGALSRRRTSMSIQRLCRGRRASRSAGCEVMKIQPWRFFDHSRAVHSVLASVFVGSSRKLSATRLNEPSTPDRWCGADGSISEASSVSFDAAVDLFRVRHPLHQLLRRGQFEKQMSEDFLRAFDEEFALPVVGWLEERGSNRSRFRAPDQLLRRSPIGAAAVERIEHNVAAASRHKTAR